MRDFDLFPSSFSLDHNPGNQISTDPSSIIGTGTDMLSNIILEIPKMVLQILAAFLSNPLNYLDDLLQLFPFFDFTGIPFGDLLDWVDTIPILGDIVGAITGVLGGGLDVLELFFGNILSFLGGDFTDPSFNVITVAENFITSILNPTNLIAILTGGLLSGGVIPGLDASKIISGLFSMDMIDGLLDFLDGVPILGDIVEAITGIVGGGFPDLSTFFSNITGFLGGGDFASGIFSIPAAALSFFSGVLDPLGLIFSQGQLGDAGSYDPWPFSWGGDWVSTLITPLTQFIRNFLGWIPGLADLNFDTTQVGQQFTQNKLIPSGTLAPLIEGLIPDEFAPVVVQNTIDGIVNGAAGIVEDFINDNPVTAVFDALFGHRTATNVAQNSADTANARNIIQDAQLAQQQVVLGGGSARTISDDFNRQGAPTLGTNWFQRVVEGSGGQSGVDGSGNANWSPGGVDNCLMNNIWSVTDLATDTQMCGFTLVNGVKNGAVGQPELRTIARSNANGDTNVVGRLRSTQAEVGYVIADVYTRLGSIVGISHTAGDTWELRCGSLLDERQFVFLQNGVTKVDVTDSTDASAMGTSPESYRYVGFAQLAGTDFFWVPLQISPGSVQAVSAADRMAS